MIECLKNFRALRSPRRQHDLPGGIKVDLSVHLRHIGRTVTKDRARTFKSVNLPQFGGGVVAELVG